MLQNYMHEQEQRRAKVWTQMRQRQCVHQRRRTRERERALVCRARALLTLGRARAALADAEAALVAAEDAFCEGNDVGAGNNPGERPSETSSDSRARWEAVPPSAEAAACHMDAQLALEAQGSLGPSERARSASRSGKSATTLRSAGIVAVDNDEEKDSSCGFSIGSLVLVLLRARHSVHFGAVMGAAPTTTAEAEATAQPSVAVAENATEKTCVAPSCPAGTRNPDVEVGKGERGLGAPEQDGPTGAVCDDKHDALDQAVRVLVKIAIESEDIGGDSDAAAGSTSVSIVRVPPPDIILLPKEMHAVAEAALRVAHEQVLELAQSGTVTCDIIFAISFTFTEWPQWHYRA